MRRLILTLLILAWPLAEIAGFIIVGRQIGVFATIGLVLATGIAGGILMRLQGFAVVSRIRADLAASRDPGREIAHGVMILLAGVLLLLPGFVTDILGLMLFIPPLRDLAWRFLRERVQVTAAFSSQRGGWRRSPRVIDLDQDDYTAAGDPKSPWKPLDRS